MSSTRSKTPAKSKTKEGLGLCQHRGCRKYKHDESHFCDYHADQFFYIDAAYKVNVTGLHIPFHGVYKRIHEERKKIIEEHYVGEVITRMKAMELKDDDPSESGSDSDEPYDHTCIQSCTRKGQIVTCRAPVSHQGRMCPKHLRIAMIKSMRNAHKFIATMRERYEDDDDIKEKLAEYVAKHQLPEEVRQRCRDVVVAAPEAMQINQCRFESANGASCYHHVDDFFHLGWCGTHIHTPQAILCIIKRLQVLNSGILFKNLREMVVSMI